jgi:hypothetical protein
MSSSNLRISELIHTAHLTFKSRGNIKCNVTESSTFKNEVIETKFAKLFATPNLYMKKISKGHSNA